MPGPGFTTRDENVRRARNNFVVEGQDRTRTSVGEVPVHVFRLFCWKASSISRVEVPESHWKMWFRQ